MTDTANGGTSDISEGIDWSEAAGHANAPKTPLESVCEESEIEEDNAKAEPVDETNRKTADETGGKTGAEMTDETTATTTVKATAKTATETTIQTTDETPAEKPKAASMVDLPKELPLKPCIELRTPNHSVGDLAESPSPKGPAVSTQPMQQTKIVQEYRAVIPHKRCPSGMSGHISRGSGTVSPSVTMQHLQSPGRTRSRGYSSMDMETPSTAGEVTIPSEEESCHSIVLTSDGGATPGVDYAAKREWSQVKLDIMFDKDKIEEGQEVEPVAVQRASDA